jgi:hypothetical protein
MRRSPRAVPASGFLIVVGLAVASCGKTADFDAIVERGGACATDADCRCYPGGISPKHGCGGVTDAKSAAELEAIAKKQGPTEGIDCAAWMCAPICERGRCINGPRRAP